MNQLVRQPLVVTLLLATLLGGGLLGGRLLQGNTPVVQAQTSGETTLPRTITVVGEGTVSIEPDIAQANIGVEIFNASVQEASAEARAVMEQVIEALQQEGVVESDIQTSGYNIFAERMYGPEGPSGDDEIRYRVTNNVAITIRDLSQVGSVLESAIDAGANNVFGVNFSLDDPSTVESEARESAVADAAAKAAELATLHELSVGPVISISEVIGGNGGVFADNFSAESVRAFGGGGGPILPGELQLTMRLEIVYTLE